MSAVKVKINKQGRLVIPAALREAAGIANDSTVLLEVTGPGELKVKRRDLKATLDSIRERFREHVPLGVDVVEELIREHRKEAERE